MRCYHGTQSGQQVLDAGRFLDVESTYGMQKKHTGVWLTDCEPTQPDDAPGEWIFVLDVPEDVIRPYEWVSCDQDGKPLALGPREFIVPAEIINAHCRPLLYDDELQEAE